MSTTTTNYSLVKPATTDLVDITVINGDLDIIDTRLKADADAILTKVPYVEAVNTVAAAGATRTLAVTATQSINDLTLTENCTITLPAATAGTSFTLVLRQGGVGSFTVTFTPTPKWANGAVPVLSTAVGAIDIITGFYVTSWNLGVVGLAFA